MAHVHGGIILAKEQLAHLLNYAYYDMYLAKCTFVLFTLYVCMGIFLIALFTLDDMAADHFLFYRVSHIETYFKTSVS